MVLVVHVLIQKAKLQATLHGLTYHALFKTRNIGQHERHIIIPYHVIPTLVNLTQ